MIDISRLGSESWGRWDKKVTAQPFLSLSIITVLNRQYPSKSTARGLKRVEQFASAIHHNHNFSHTCTKPSLPLQQLFFLLFKVHRRSGSLGAAGLAATHTASWLPLSKPCIRTLLSAYIWVGYMLRASSKQGQATGTSHITSFQCATRYSAALQTKCIYSVCYWKGK